MIHMLSMGARARSPTRRTDIWVDKSMGKMRKTSFPNERRRYPRFDFSLALAYQWGNKKDTLRIVDLSLGGIKIQTGNPIPVDESLDLIILLENEVIKPVGKVVRSDAIASRMYDVGICFESISEQCVSRLEEFLHGIVLEGDQAKREQSPGQSGLEGLESKCLELDRVRVNFLRWLHKSYPGDYQRYERQPRIGENDIRDFLKSKGIDRINIYYLMRSLKR
jgi:hypothetical protein